jgi:hypothetical protein
VTGRPADLLALLLSRPLVEALEARMREIAEEVFAAELDRRAPRWIPLAQAAAVYGCSPHALRQRIKRGTVEAHRGKGRLLYVPADPGESNGRSQ